MKISEVSERTGLSIPTIRYYEKSGICPRIARGLDGRRRFTATDADWFLLLASLRETGMSLSDMRAFAALYQSGQRRFRRGKPRCWPIETASTKGRRIWIGVEASLNEN